MQHAIQPAFCNSNGRIAVRRGIPEEHQLLRPAARSSQPAPLGAFGPSACSLLPAADKKGLFSPRSRRPRRLTFPHRNLRALPRPHRPESSTAESALILTDSSPPPPKPAGPSAACLQPYLRESAPCSVWRQGGAPPSSPPFLHRGASLCKLCKPG